MAKANVGSRRPAILTRTLGDQDIDVVGVLGEGAFAVVFSCKVNKGQRDVAVKVEHTVSTESRVSLFLRNPYIARRGVRQ